MAYIDPEGMFGGDRMALLSDSAKMAWPWFWCSSNTVGRMELNYSHFLRGAFRQFRKPPTEKQFWEWVEEFHESHLMFVYQVNAQAWGQWDVSERYLPDYKREGDKRTPAPIAKDFLEWRDSYQSSKSQALSSKCRIFSISRNSEKLPESSGSFSLGVGVGEERNKPSFAADAAGAIELPPQDPIEATAARLVAAHPTKRRCSVKEAEKRLRAIVKPLPRSEWAAKLARIEANHAGWRVTDQWTKDGGEYAKGLANWLAPTEGRYDLDPPARASPVDEFQFQRPFNPYVKPTMPPPEATDDRPITSQPRP